MTPDDLARIDACPACGADQLAPSETIEKPYRLNYSRCRACNLMFMNPMPRQAWYDRFYAGEFWEEKGKNKKGAEKELRAQLGKEADRAHAIVDFLRGANIASGLAIELGCAYGLIVRSIGHRLGLEPAGIEPSDQARAFAEKHIRIVGKTAADLPNVDPSTVALIIMPNVLENITEPAAVLSAIRRRFKAHVVIVTPDPLRARAISLYHPFVYSAQAMSALLTRTGFDVLRHAHDPNDPQAQMFLAAPGTGTSPVPSPPSLFTIRRRIGLYRTRLNKRGPKRKLRMDDWDNETVSALLTQAALPSPLHSDRLG